MVKIKTKLCPLIGPLSLLLRKQKLRNHMVILRLLSSLNLTTSVPSCRRLRHLQQKWKGRSPQNTQKGMMATSGKNIQAIESAYYVNMGCFYIGYVGHIGPCKLHVFFYLTLLKLIAKLMCLQ